ncbi:type II secretion system F family protein [Vibrio sp. SS-MA-C1-2]|nr:type II secretion system F family protein [Vibrio sp. SS-MA-C1-2]UJF17514.1 type II secretion system F family protein [Vibrio sp. SS-MA-C1-2]
MLTILLPLLLVALLISLAVTHYLTIKTRKLNASRFLDHKVKINLNWFHEFLGGLGKNQQRELKSKFEDAGIYNAALSRYFAPVKYTILFAFLLLCYLSGLPINDLLIYILLIFIFILVAPDMYLVARKKRIIESNSRQLPYMLDMMSVCVQTGMTLEASFRYLSDELQSFDKDLCYQIRKTSDAAAIKGLELALKDLAERIPTTSVRSFTLTLTQNIQYGTSISNVLSDLAEDMRKEQILSMEEKIGKLSAKMSGPLILLIMFPIIILILAPPIMRSMG